MRTMDSWTNYEMQRTGRDRDGQRETEAGRDSGQSSKPDYDWMWIRFPNRWSRSEAVRCISQQRAGEGEGEERSGEEAEGMSVSSSSSSQWQYGGTECKTCNGEMCLHGVPRTCRILVDIEIESISLFIVLAIVPVTKSSHGVKVTRRLILTDHYVFI